MNSTASSSKFVSGCFPSIQCASRMLSLISLSWISRPPGPVFDNSEAAMAWCLSPNLSSASFSIVRQQLQCQTLLGHAVPLPLVSRESECRTWLEVQSTKGPSFLDTNRMSVIFLSAWLLIARRHHPPQLGLVLARRYLPDCLPVFRLPPSRQTTNHEQNKAYLQHQKYHSQQRSACGASEVVFLTT